MFEWLLRRFASTYATVVSVVGKLDIDLPLVKIQIPSRSFSFTSLSIEC
jgi:hypothetical protein